MKCKILIRTHAPDADWLNWCIQSCKKHVPEAPVVVVCPIGDIDKINVVTRKFNIPAQGVYPANSDGYIDQQWTKLNADEFCKDCNYIIHVDSDCLWTAGIEGLFTEDEYTIKPIMLKTPYADIKGSGAEVWQEITRKALGWKPAYEYMRRHPLVYPRWVYAQVRKYLRHVHEEEGLEAWVKGIRNRELSEFNILGAWCDQFAFEAFDWVDTSVRKTLPDTVMRQGWSWGGMTPEVLKEWGDLA